MTFFYRTTSSREEIALQGSGRRIDARQLDTARGRPSPTLTWRTCLRVLFALCSQMSSSCGTRADLIAGPAIDAAIASAATAGVAWIERRRSGDQPLRDERRTGFARAQSGL